MFAPVKTFRGLREDIKDILVADRFNEDLFYEGNKEIGNPAEQEASTMTEAVLMRAKQLPAAEREPSANCFLTNRGQTFHLPGLGTNRRNEMPMGVTRAPFLGTIPG